MKIYGYFDDRYEPPAPFIEIILTSKSLGIKRIVDFHIDTGASVSMLLDKDIQSLNIDTTKLKVSRTCISGIGGAIDTYLVDDAEFAFKTENGKLHSEKLKLYVGRHDLSKFTEVDRLKIMGIPSLLGRDILYRFRFVCDKRRKQLYLED